LGFPTNGASAATALAAARGALVEVTRAAL
jgi:hypothetical protein